MGRAHCTASSHVMKPGDISNDPETKRQSVKWVFPGNGHPLKDNKCWEGDECKFFAMLGHIISVPLENQCTVTAVCFTTVCLPKLRENTAHERHQELHSSHGQWLCTQWRNSAHLKVDFFMEHRLGCMCHLHYSPDLAPCNFCSLCSKRQKRALLKEVSES